jgi:hypothetical protein
VIVKYLGYIKKKVLAEELAGKCLRFLDTPDGPDLVEEVINAIWELDFYRRETELDLHALDLLGDEMRVGVYNLQHELCKHESPMLPQLCARWPQNRRIHFDRANFVDDINFIQTFEEEAERLFDVAQQKRREEEGKQQQQQGEKK